MQIWTAMDDIGKQVLNEKWVSVPRGSEYFSFHIKNQNEEQLFVLEDERYELDNHIAMTGSTIEALNNLKDEYEQTQCSEEEFIKLRDKHLSIAKIKWIKHIYNCNINSAENDDRYKFLNISTPVVISVIIDRLSKTKKNWEGTRIERNK